MRPAEATVTGWAEGGGVWRLVLGSVGLAAGTTDAVAAALERGSTNAAVSDKKRLLARYRERGSPICSP